MLLWVIDANRKLNKIGFCCRLKLGSFSHYFQWIWWSPVALCSKEPRRCSAPPAALAPCCLTQTCGCRGRLGLCPCMAGSLCLCWPLVYELVASWNHLSWMGPLKAISPTPLQWTGMPTAPLGAQSLSSLTVAVSRDIHHLSGQPVSVPHCPYCKKNLFFSVISEETLGFHYFLLIRMHKSFFSKRAVCWSWGCVLASLAAQRWTFLLFLVSLRPWGLL